MPRGFNVNRPVVAYERHQTVHYRSLREVCETYGIADHHLLERMIEKGQLAPDGYTTFDWDEERCQ